MRKLLFVLSSLAKYASCHFTGGHCIFKQAMDQSFRFITQTTGRQRSGREAANQAAQARRESRAADSKTISLHTSACKTHRKLLPPFESSLPRRQFGIPARQERKENVWNRSLIIRNGTVLRCEATARSEWIQYIDTEWATASSPQLGLLSPRNWMGVFPKLSTFFPPKFGISVS